MKTLHILSFVLIASVAARAADETRTITITAGDALHFSVTQIEARPGEKIRIVLRNESSLPKTVMGHNWVLLKSGSDPSSYAARAVSAKGEGYEPQSLSSEVLAAIPLVGGGEQGEITFEAPNERGAYPFLCSSPAHAAAGMHGVLTVR